MATSTQPKIAVLDDYNGLAPGYLASLSNASVTVYRDTILPADDLDGLVDQLGGYDVLVTMRERTPITKDLISRLPKLRVILTTGMRNKGIDLDACRDAGVKVYGTPGESLGPPVPSSFNATVQHTWALILSLANNIPRDQSLITGGPGWISHLPLNTFIGGKTLGLLGLGRLGFGVARIATLAFGINVLAWSPNLTQAKVDEQIANDPSLPPGCITVAKSQLDLFASSDILSIHLVLSDRSRGIVTKTHLEAMPPTSFLINTSRGPLIAEGDLLEVLTKGGIRGFATDVFDNEPLPANSRWRTEEWGRDGRSQVVMTPHTGYSFEHTLKEMWQRTRENLDRLVRGEEPQWPLE